MTLRPDGQSAACGPRWLRVRPNFEDSDRTSTGLGRPPSTNVSENLRLRANVSDNIRPPRHGPVPMLSTTLGQDRNFSDKFLAEAARRMAAA